MRHIVVALCFVVLSLDGGDRPISGNKIAGRAYGEWRGGCDIKEGEEREEEGAGEEIHCGSKRDDLVLTSGGGDFGEANYLS